MPYSVRYFERSFSRSDIWVGVCQLSHLDELFTLIDQNMGRVAFPAYNL
jgi:hypothetical protein